MNNNNKRQLENNAFELILSNFSQYFLNLHNFVKIILPNFIHRFVIRIIWIIFFFKNIQ